MTLECEGGLMVQIFSGELNRNSYGNIQRSGSLPNGRTVYRVIDSNGKEAGKLSVPNEQKDVFEKAYADILDSAPKIQKYAREHSSEKERAKRLQKFRTIVTLGGVTGAVVPLVALRNSSSVTKQILATVGGILTGISAGFGASLAINSPPGTLKFAIASHELSKVDVQPVKDIIA